MKSYRLLFPALCAMLLVSCYGTKTLEITSEPAGANVRINGKPVGVTPLTTEIEQDKDLGIVAQKPGYEAASRTLRTRKSLWLSIIWSQNDPWAKYIEDDKVELILKPIPSVSSYKPGVMPAYTGGKGSTRDLFQKKARRSSSATPPKLPPMPTMD